MNPVPKFNYETMVFDGTVDEDMVSFLKEHGANKSSKKTKNKNESFIAYPSYGSPPPAYRPQVCWHGYFWDIEWKKEEFIYFWCYFWYMKV